MLHYSVGPSSADTNCYYILFCLGGINKKEYKKGPSIQHLEGLSCNIVLGITCKP